MMLMLAVFVAVFAVLGGGMMVAFAGPSAGKAGTRRLTALKDRHAPGAVAAVEAQLRRVIHHRDTKFDDLAKRFLPRPEQLKKRLAMTGKNWTPAKYLVASLAIVAVVLTAGVIKGLPVFLSLLLGMFLGLAIPHKFVGMTIAKRLKNFNKRFPDAIELLVRGLRSGLPISETLGVVATELPGPVGEEFRAVSDKIKIGRTMDAALQETADRLGTPEFQFFVISLQIQRETGGNLAETLSNLANVLRGRMQMKLKVKAMSSESKASAYIIGSLPFFVFTMIYYVNPGYMGQFFTNPLLTMIGAGGLCWMGIGAFVMAQMINFEI